MPLIAAHGSHRLSWLKVDVGEGNHAYNGSDALSAPSKSHCHDQVAEMGETHVV